MTPAHYIFRNVVLGKSLDNGFCSKKGVAYPWAKFNNALWSLKYAIDQANKGNLKRAEEFLKPFEGAFTIEDLKKLDVEQFKRVA